ncbi:MAG: hypothetical protein AB8H80_09515 [Planctomycetota bacterium]
MVAQVLVRSLLLLVATGLAGCAASGPAKPTVSRPVVVREGEPCTLAMVASGGLTLTLQNESYVPPAEAYSRSDDTGRKVVPDAELQALCDVLSLEELWQHALPRTPNDAREVVQLQNAGRTWTWARRGSFTDPREAAFRDVRNYFMALYNGNTAFHSDRRQGWDSDAIEASRKARKARDRLDQLPKNDRGTAGGAKNDGGERR